MRWDQLRVENEQLRALPGYREPAAIRTFDAPEALDTRFYEVRAKSALNKVPKASRMPFRWTVNPYRGCTHACTYCLGGDTPILMSDGHTKQMADLRAGEIVVGTMREGTYRCYRPSRVLDHWRTEKVAHRVVLEDGTELVASGDHRFLTDRGWKHVTGAEQGTLRRPHLTVNTKLMGTGAFAESPQETEDYRQGYLCGMVRGDGHLGSYSYQRAGRAHGDVHRFRLALADFEGLKRTKEYLAAVDVKTDEFEFAAAAGTHRRMGAIRTQTKESVRRIGDLIRWPRWPSPEWRRGFLAGIYDAEGSCSGSVFRIGNTDPELLDATLAGMRWFGFTVRVEDLHRANGMTNIRLLGGLREQLRFFHTVGPAITRKRPIEGRRLKSQAKLGVVEIEPVAERMELFDIATETGDFIADGVVSHNCFARPTHTYLDFNAGRDFEKEIVVKVNAPEVLRAELSRPSWQREHVAMGTNTDPYQWVEGRYKLMPGIWEALRDTGTPGSILTKSPLLLRDLELMKEVPGIQANLSVPTLEEKAWRATEPHTPHPRARLEAVGELNRAGIPCGILIAPLMPGINDSPEQVERILELAAENGAVSVGGVALHLRGEVRGLFFDWLRSQRPDLLPLYERLYARGAYAPRAERERLSELVRKRSPDGVAPGVRRGFLRPVERGEPRSEVAHPQTSLF